MAEEDNTEKEAQEATKEEQKPQAQEGEEGAASEEGAEGGKKKNKKKLIIIGAVALVLLIVVGLVVSGVFGGGDKEEVVADAAPTATDAAADAKPAEPLSAEEMKKIDRSNVVYYELPEFIVNLNASGSKVNFLKMKIVLELVKQEDVPLIEAQMPRIVDAFNMYVRELRSSDLEGSAGMYRLRQELLMRINRIMAPTPVLDILFKEMIVQ